MASRKKVPASAPSRNPVPAVLEKSPTGIQGLDEITFGGLPKGRPTLVCGNAGCGKTMIGMGFLVNGAVNFGEPGVFMTFEESRLDLVRNFSSLGVDIDSLEKERKLAVDYVHIDRSEIEETGSYDLQGLFIRLQLAIDSVKAKRVVLDTVESLFAGLNESILRAELRRLFRWLKEREITAVVTGERGGNGISRYGLEEYVADCVILLDNRVNDQISTRRLRIVKYRGSSHGTNEYPFLIGKQGISILPITSNTLENTAGNERISSGVPLLDGMLGGKGYFRGSTILVSGPAGSGKTSFAAKFMESAVRSGKRGLYFAFEESPGQLHRNMASIGMDLAGLEKSGLCRFCATRPTFFGLEQHLLSLHDQVREFKPDVVVIDPITNLLLIGNTLDVKSMLIRLADFMKNQGITALCTDLSVEEQYNTGDSHAGVGISSLVDSWVVLRPWERGGRRGRCLYVLKSRGMAHSDQVTEFAFSSGGIVGVIRDRGGKQ